MGGGRRIERGARWEFSAERVRGQGVVGGRGRGWFESHRSGENDRFDQIMMISRSSDGCTDAIASAMLPLQILAEQQAGLAHLTKILQKDMKDVAVIYGEGEDVQRPEESVRSDLLSSFSQTLRGSTLR